MANQSEIDALTQALTDAKAQIEAEITDLEAQIAAGKGSELDLTKLKEAVGGITSIPVPQTAPAGETTSAASGAEEQAPTESDGTHQQA